MFEGETKLEKKNLEDFKLNAEQKFSASQTIRYYSHYPSFTQHCQGIVNRTLQSEFWKQSNTEQFWESFKVMIILFPR